MNIKLKITILSSSLFLLAVLAYLRIYSRQFETDEVLMSNIMNYSMINVVKRCQKDFGYNDDDMIMLERELKRYLILCAIKENANTSVNMYSTDVDNLWHSFILFTKEYANFCNKNARHFIHHTPRVNETITPEELQESRKAFRAFIETYEKIFKEEIHPIWLLDRCPV